jgi:hypothetical protein
MCGEVFCSATPKQTKAKHKKHVDKECKVFRFWKAANKILGRELMAKEVGDLLGIKYKFKEQKK